MSIVVRGDIDGNIIQQEWRLIAQSDLSSYFFIFRI